MSGIDYLEFFQGQCFGALACSDEAYGEDQVVEDAPRRSFLAGSSSDCAGGLLAETDGGQHQGSQPCGRLWSEHES